MWKLAGAPPEDSGEPLQLNQAGMRVDENSSTQADSLAQQAGTVILCRRTRVLQAREIRCRATGHFDDWRDGSSRDSVQVSGGNETLQQNRTDQNREEPRRQGRWLRPAGAATGVFWSEEPHQGSSASV